MKTLTKLCCAILTTGFMLAQTASANLVFDFKDKGDGTVFVSGSGSTDLFGAYNSFFSTVIGWDNLGPDDSPFATVGNSDLITFNPFLYGNNFQTFTSALGATPLNVGGVQLDRLWADGPDFGVDFPFFALRFLSDIPTGNVTASGNATLNIAFEFLPYNAGSVVDVTGNGNIFFTFTEVPEPATLAMFGLGLIGLVFKKRKSVQLKAGVSRL